MKPIDTDAGPGREARPGDPDARRDWTLLDTLGPAADFLSAAGVENARFDAELLLARVLGVKRLDLYLQYERILTPDERGAFRGLLKRRREREPLQLILGDVEFFSLPFTVRPGVFIPRPETELLVERLLERLEALRPEGAPAADPDGDAVDSPAAPGAADPTAGPRGLELGAGSGVICCSLAHARADLRIWASDRSPEALALTASNAEALGVADRVGLEQADGLPAGDGEGVHFVVSNPPYVADGEAADLQPEVADHDPPAALFAGPDGLDVHRRLAAEAPARLVPGGILAMELGAGQGEALRALLCEAGWIDVEILKDYARHDRIAIARLP